MKSKEYILAALLILICHTGTKGQETLDSSGTPRNHYSVDDPSQFFTRAEVFSELQHFKNDLYINQSTLRVNAKLGSRFTTRLDIPVVYNSIHREGQKRFGLGDISFRILGYKLIESPKSAVTASVEFSLNTAGSTLLGSGKNAIIPVVTYTRQLRQFHGFASMVIQQVNSLKGSESRTNFSFSKLQAILVKNISRKAWIATAPTLYIDYTNGGTSMNFESRMVIVPKPRVNLWMQAGFGVYGDFRLRYLWSTQFGYRYLMFRSKSLHRNKETP